MQASPGRRFDVLLDGIGLPQPFTLAGFCQRLEEARGRPVVLAPFSTNHPEAPTGVWAAFPDADVIFYEQGTSPLHSEHFVFHETGHMLFGHAGRHDALLTFLDRFLPAGCDAGRLAEAMTLQRTSYTLQQERDAEAFARHVGARVRRARTLHPALAPEAAGAFERAVDTLAPRR